MKRQIPPLASLGRDDNGAELGDSVMVSEAEPSDALRRRSLHSLRPVGMTVSALRCCRLAGRSGTATFPSAN